MAKRSKKNDRISGGEGWSIGGDQPTEDSSTAPLPPAFQRIKIKQGKGKKGHMVTTVGPLQLASGDIKTLASDLKKLSGGGGSFDSESITLQGEHAEKVSNWLKKQGWGLG